MLLPFKHVQGLEREITLQGLSSFLSRALQQGRRSSSFECDLFHLFEYSGIGGAFPVAAITRMIDGGFEGDGYWFRADPVCLQPNRDQITMLGNAGLGVRAEEREQLSAEFNALFSEDGLYLEASVNDRWYMRCEESPSLCTTPLRNVIGKNIDDYLPRGEAALHWHKILNEIQMLFFSSTVNDRRRQAGKPEISSVWLWGGGVLPESRPVRWQSVWANDVVSRGLARFHGVESSTLPENLLEWLDHEVEGDSLVVFDVALNANEQRDLAAWQRFVCELDCEWIVPAISALKDKKIHKITLVTETNSYELTRRALKRWWRRPRSLSHYE